MPSVVISGSVQGCSRDRIGLNEPFSPAYLSNPVLHSHTPQRGLPLPVALSPNIPLLSHTQD